jgi:hypothetical protein
MSAEAGRYLLAFGPWGLIAPFAYLLLRFLGTVVILFIARKWQIGEGEIRISMSGIHVRWGIPSDESEDKTRAQVGDD